MPKKVLILLILLVGLFFAVPKVEVKAMEAQNVEYRLAKTNTGNNADCKKIDAKGKFIAFLQDLFNIIKFAGPILCLVLSTMDFIKAAASQDKEAMKKAAQTSLKRLGLAILLFFIPTLINFLFPLLGWNGTCGIT